MSSRVRLILGLTASALLLLTACRREPTPTPVPPTPTQAAGPTLSVLREVVQYRERETDPLEELAEGDSMDVAPGANIVVGDSGRATLDWPRFLQHELVSRADTLLSLSEPNARHAILDQAAGTGRYVVEGSGEPTDLQVNAGFLSLGQSVAIIEVSQGPADFIVSIDDEDKPMVWVAMLDGTAQVMRGSDAVTLTAGDVATFSQDDDLAEPFELDTKLVEAWYDRLADGTSEDPIASVAFFCRVTQADTPLLVAPVDTATAAGEPLASGVRVKVLGRNDEATFVRIETDTGEGWVNAERVTCVAVIPAAPVVIVGPTPTPTLLATRLPTVGTPTASPTLGLATLTPTPTVTGEPYTFNFGASPGTIDQGECSTLSWEVYGVQAVYLDGDGVAGGSQSRKVCPDDTTTYTMEVIKLDGSSESKSATVKVVPKEETSAPPEPTTTTPPTLPPEPEDTPEPETPEPTSAARR